MLEMSETIRRLLSGTAPGQTIYTKEQAAEADTGLPSGWQAAIDLLNEASAAAATSDDAATALQEELARASLDIERGHLGVAQGQLGVARGQLALAEEAQAFTQEDIRTQRLLEAAGLATGPTGAIQLAYLARGRGAPQAEVASIFQNLPFIQELLHGQDVAGFGLPEQLGGEMRRVSGEGGTIEGKNLGVTLPGKKAITQQAFGTLSAFEQEFLGALGQSETGQSVEGFLEDIMKSFIPTRAAGALSIG